MRIAVLGMGCPGPTHAASASLGHEVLGPAVREAKLAKLCSGETPFNQVLTESRKKC